MEAARAVERVEFTMVSEPEPFACTEP